MQKLREIRRLLALWQASATEAIQACDRAVKAVDGLPLKTALKTEDLPEWLVDQIAASEMASTHSPVVYDPITDSMYIEIRPEVSTGCRVDDARNLVVDLDADGRVVGYDIQRASQHPDVIAEALAELRAAQRGGYIK